MGPKLRGNAGEKATRKNMPANDAGLISAQAPGTSPGSFDASGVAIRFRPADFALLGDQRPHYPGPDTE